MTDLIKRISKIIDIFFSKEQQFTLLDVSNAVKNDGGPFVRHTEIRDSAKPILDIIMKHNSVYEVHPIDVVTSHGPDIADLYTPYYIDPDDYKAVSQVASKPKFNMNQIQNHPLAQPIPVPANKIVINCTTSVPDVAKRAKAYKLVKPRSDGSITVPKFLFEEAGFIGGDGVDIANHPNSISVVRGATRSLSDDGDFRISKTALENSNMFNVPVFVCAFSDKIVIAEK